MRWTLKVHRRWDVNSIVHIVSFQDADVNVCANNKTTRLNAEPPEQNYSLPSSTSNATMHCRIIMSRGGSSSSSSSSSRPRQVRVVQEMLRRGAERHCSSGRRAEKTDKRRQRWDIGVEVTGNGRAGLSTVGRACLMCFGWTRHPGRGCTTTQRRLCEVQITAQNNDSLAVSIWSATAADAAVLLVRRRHHHHRHIVVYLVKPCSPVTWLQCTSWH